MFLMMKKALFLLILHASSRSQASQAVGIRQFGPYGRYTSPSDFVTSGYGNSFSNEAQQHDSRHLSSNNWYQSNQNSYEDNKQQSLSVNHNFDNNPSSYYHDSGYQNGNSYYNDDMSNGGNSIDNRRYSDGYSAANANSFNGFGFELKPEPNIQSAQQDQRDRFILVDNNSNNKNGPNSQKLEQLIRLYQENPTEFQQRLGLNLGDYADILISGLSGNRRSSSGMFGTGVGKKTMDVYSIFAIGMFAAFIAYIVYFFISVEGGGEGGRGGATRLDISREGDLLGILSDVTNAFARWTVFEYMQDGQHDTNEEESAMNS